MGLKCGLLPGKFFTDLTGDAFSLFKPVAGFSEGLIASRILDIACCEARMIGRSAHWTRVVVFQLGCQM